MNSISENLPSLPTEILEHTFLGLSGTDLTACRRVCKLWLLIADQSRIWKTAFLKEFRYLPKSRVSDWKTRYRSRILLIKHIRQKQNKAIQLEIPHSLVSDPNSLCQRVGSQAIFIARGGTEFSILDFQSNQIRSKEHWIDEKVVFPEPAAKKVKPHAVVGTDCLVRNHFKGSKLISQGSRGFTIWDILTEESVLSFQNFNYRHVEYVDGNFFLFFHDHVVVLDENKRQIRAKCPVRANYCLFRPPGMVLGDSTECGAVVKGEYIFLKYAEDGSDLKCQSLFVYNWKGGEEAYRLTDLPFKHHFSLYATDCCLILAGMSVGIDKQIAQLRRLNDGTLIASSPASEYAVYQSSLVTIEQHRLIEISSTSDGALIASFELESPLILFDDQRQRLFFLSKNQIFLFDEEEKQLAKPISLPQSKEPCIYHLSYDEEHHLLLVQMDSASVDSESQSSLLLYDVSSSQLLWQEEDEACAAILTMAKVAKVCLEPHLIAQTLKPGTKISLIDFN